MTPTGNTQPCSASLKVKAMVFISLMIAARIAALSAAGTVLVGPETARRITGLFTVRQLGIRPLKNITEDVMIYQILGNTERQGEPL